MAGVRRFWLLAVLVLLLGIIVVAGACGGGSQNEAPPTEGKSEPPATDAGGPKQGGVLVEAVSASPTAWDLTKADWITWRGVQHLYDTLLFADEKEQLQPWLVESWDVSDDGLVYTLHLRHDVVFHDGTPFNAEAVKFNFERHSAADSRYNYVYQKIASIETPDDYTVKITLNNLDVYFVYDLAGWGTIQLSPTAVAKLGPDFATQPVGTGPFKFKAYEPDSYIDYVRNEDYWRGAPLLDGVRVRIIPEDSVMVAELRAGTVDIGYPREQKDAKLLEEEGLVITKTAAPGAQFVSLNVSKGLTAQFPIRRAIALSIDRDTIIDQVLFGFAEKSRAGVPTLSPFYHPEIPMIEYDPEKAGQMLDEAGWTMGDDGVRYKDGAPLKLDILNTENYAQFNEIIQEQLRRVGMDSEMRTMEWGAYLDKWRSEGDFEMTYHSQGSSFHSTAVIPAAWNPSNYWTIHHIRYSQDPELLEVSDQLENLYNTINMTPDAARRVELGGEVQKLIQDNQLVVWLWHAQSTTARQPYIKDAELTESGRVFKLGKAWLDK